MLREAGCVKCFVELLAGFVDQARRGSPGSFGMAARAGLNADSADEIK
jgi:hypothetical protein